MIKESTMIIIKIAFIWKEILYTNSAREKYYNIIIPLIFSLINCTKNNNNDNEIMSCLFQDSK